MRTPVQYGIILQFLSQSIIAMYATDAGQQSTGTVESAGVGHDEYPSCHKAEEAEFGEAAACS